MDKELLSRKKSHQERPLGFFKSPTIDDDEGIESPAEPIHQLEEGHMKDGTAHHVHEHHRHRYGPAFQRHPEATPSELFYDLFFVANLATFTGHNEVINGKGLSDYIGYFCVIWFTWFQVALYDVRFSRDSVFDRLCKVAQFGVQVGFSFVAIHFDPAGANDEMGASVNGQALSLLIMASRIILFFQYLSLWYCLRRWSDKRVPLSLMVASCFTAAMIFLGVSFTFNAWGATRIGSYSYVAWYVVSVMESLIHIGIACRERYFSFKGTHLVERMGLMTLIVLGEGILGLSQAVITVWNQSNYFTALGISVASTILLIYGMYMLYFDTLSEEHFGTVRMQIWAFLHFPLHMALVLFDEGTKQFVIWNTCYRQLTEYSNFIEGVQLFQEFVFQANYNLTGVTNSTEFFHSQAEALQGTVDSFLSLPDIINYDSAFNQSMLDEFAEMVANGAETDPWTVKSGVLGFFGEVSQGIFGVFNIEGSGAEDLGYEAGNLVTEALADYSLFDLVFIYFYAAIGLALLLMLTLWIISKRSRNTWFDYVRFTAWGAVGVTLCFLTLFDLSAAQYEDPGDSFINGNWVLPAPMIMILGLTILFHLPFGRK